MSDAIESQGFKFEIGSSPTEVKEVTKFDGLDGKASEIDRTHLQSSAKEFLMGLQDWGNWNLDLNYLPGDPGQDLVRAAKATRTLTDFKATFSDASFIEFQAYVLSASVSGAVDGKVDTSFSLRISGDVTFST